MIAISWSSATLKTHQIIRFVWDMHRYEIDNNNFHFKSTINNDDKVVVSLKFGQKVGGDDNNFNMEKFLAGIELIFFPTNFGEYPITSEGERTTSIIPSFRYATAIWQCFILVLII